MKKTIFFSIVIFSFFLSYSQDKAGYEIFGKLKGMEDGGKVSMQLFNSKAYHSYEKYLTIPDSGIIKNGEFHIKGVVPDGPRRYWLNVAYSRNEFGRYKNKTIELWIANGEKITLESDTPLDSIHHGFIEHYVTITGSPTTESRMRLEPLREFYYQNLEGVYASLKKIQDSTGFNPSAVESILSLRNQLNFLLYRLILWPDGVDPDRQAARMVFLGEFNPAGHPDFWVKVYNNLSEQEKNSFNGKWLKELVNISVGQPFPEFNLLTPEGKLLSSKEVIAKSKMTIIHFWSANSQGRKRYQDEVRAMYKKYHDKGLNVIDVFHDDTNYDNLKDYMTVDVKKQYADILKKENFPWYSVVDWDYKNGPVETIYREGGGNNTTNVIIDAQGKIIAWEAKGVELQYHLWKAFGE